MIGLIALGKPIVEILFERGAFGFHASRMTYEALLFYTFGLWAFSGVRVMVSAFYALQDTKTPVKVAVVALFVNLISSLLLIGPLHHGGIALSLSIASSVQVFLLALFLKKKMPSLLYKPILKSFVKSLFASLIMGIGNLFSAISLFLYKFRPFLGNKDYEPDNSDILRYNHFFPDSPCFTVR